MSDKADITVAVEKAIHNALLKLVQEAWDNYGIRLEGARFTWIDVSSVDGPKFIATEISARMASLSGQE